MSESNLISDLEKDLDGNIILRPIVGWTTGTVAGTGVILAIQYIEALEELESKGKRIQLALLPAQCLELAEILTQLASTILAPLPPGKSPN
jgi:hypothetical protein